MGNLSIIRILLSSIQNFHITKKLACDVASSQRNQTETMELLLNQDEIEICKCLLMSFEIEVVELLLDQDSEIEITQEIVGAIAKHCESERILELLLNGGCNIPITERLVIAAAKNVYFGVEAIKELSDRDRNIQITEKNNLSCGG